MAKACVRPRGPASADVRRAAKLYRAFRETTPRRMQPHRFRIPCAVARIGTCEFVGYLTTHKGKLALYVHYFAPASRPAIYAGAGRGELYFIGRRFRVTGGGITDLDARGRVVDYRPRYVTLTRAEYEKLLRARLRT